MRGAKSPAVPTQKDGTAGEEEPSSTEDAHVCLGVMRKSRRERKAANENVLQGSNACHQPPRTRRQRLQTDLTVTYSHLFTSLRKCTFGLRKLLGSRQDHSGMDPKHNVKAPSSSVRAR